MGLVDFVRMMWYDATHKDELDPMIHYLAQMGIVCALLTATGFVILLLGRLIYAIVK